MWVVFQGPEYSFQSNTVYFHTNRYQEGTGLFIYLFLNCFLHLVCHLTYMLEITNSIDKERAQDMGEGLKTNSITC